MYKTSDLDKGFGYEFDADNNYSGIMLRLVNLLFSRANPRGNLPDHAPPTCMDKRFLGCRRRSASDDHTSGRTVVEPIELLTCWTSEL